MRDPAKRTRRRFVSHQPNCSAGNSPGRPCSKMSVECKPQRGLRWLIWLGCFLLSFLARVSFQKNTVVWNCSTTRKMFWKNVRKVLLQPVQTADRQGAGGLVQVREPCGLMLAIGWHRQGPGVCSTAPPVEWCTCCCCHSY